jgi:Recombinase
MAEIQWIAPSYITIYHVLTNPVYAGAYTYGKTRREVILDASGTRKKRLHKLPQSQWAVFVPNHHEGYIDWTTYEANRVRIAINTRPRPHQPGSGAMR